MANWETFDLNIRVPHRVGNVTYRTWLDELNAVEFADYHHFDSLSHVTTVQNAIDIVRDGFNPHPINDYSVVSKHRNRESHPLHNKDIIWVSPTKLDKISDTRYGNIRFSATELNQYSNYNFYVIEFINYVRENAVRVLITTERYNNLASFHLSGNGPITLVDQRWYVACSYSQNEESCDVTVEILMENVPSFDEFCYAPCTSPRPIIQNNEIVGNIVVPDDDMLGHLFFCLLAYENKQRGGTLRSNSRDINLDDLIKEIEMCTVEALNNDADPNPNQNTHENIDETDVNMKANQCLMSIDCVETFRFKRVQYFDNDKMQRISELWPVESPCAYTCILFIYDGFYGMKEIFNYRRYLSHAIEILLKVFDSDEQKKCVAGSINHFVNRIRE